MTFRLLHGTAAMKPGMMVLGARVVAVMNGGKVRSGGAAERHPGAAAGGAQGFSDEFHLGTLEALLGAVPMLQPEVRLAALMASLMDRLARFVAAAGPARQQAHDNAAAFAALRASADKVSPPLAGGAPTLG